MDGLSPYSEEFDQLPADAKEYFSTNGCDRHSTIFLIQNEFGGEDEYDIHTYISAFVFVKQLQDVKGKIGIELVAYGINDMPLDLFYEGIRGQLLSRGTKGYCGRFSENYLIGYPFVCVSLEDDEFLRKLFPKVKHFDICDQKVFHYF